MDASIGRDRLDAQTEALNQTLHTVQHRIRRCIQDTKIRRNGFSAFYRLPIEILVEIFRLSLSADFGSRHYYPALAGLSRVCARWATIVNQTPSLWTSISREDREGVISRALVKSGGCPLYVFTGRSPHARAYLSLGTFLEKVCPHAHRWRGADVTLGSGPPLIVQTFRLANVAAPQLRTLRIAFNLTGVIEGPLNLFRGRTERLQELNVVRVPLNWNSTLLTGLRTLRLSDITYGMDVNRLFKTLQQCPGLEDLSLREVRLELVYPLELPERVELSSLRRLELAALSPSRTTTELFSRVFTPEYHRFKLSCHWPTEATELMEAICRARSALNPVVSSARGIQIAINPSGLGFTAGPMILKIDVHTDSPFGTLEYLTATFGKAMECVETILSLKDDRIRDNHNGDDDDSDDDDQESFSEKDFAIISRLPLITEIYVEYTNLDLSDLIHGLGSPDIVNGVKRLPLPNLRYLYLHQHNFELSELWDMLEQRYGVSAQEKQDEETMMVELPIPFQSLEITGIYWFFNDPLFRKIEDLVGSEHVTQVMDNRAIMEEEPDEPDDCITILDGLFERFQESLAESTAFWLGR
ncbi:hypothetical protein FRB99_002000 [Tulasnella sp. 403]|nr:hypothetical protein FRB99_002000 [Tulasnella sp. 403]